LTGGDREPGTGGAMRLDKWLWFARFFKTRSLATDICTQGKVRVDGAVVTKAHYAVRPGQVLTFVQGRHVRVVRVLAPGTRRGPASEAQTLYEDLAPPAPETALPRDAPTATRDRGSGRPTKRDRRRTDRMKSEP
jgi:ribosome-associated heat shock protein Hsp15